MQRKSFIQYLTALGALGLLPANSFKHYRKFYLLQCFVAGFKFYKGMQLLPQMKEGDLLELVREPDNKYDDCAIALHWNNEKIGFIPASENALLSRLLDAHALELSAEITHLNKQVQPWENLGLAIHFLKELPTGEVPQNIAYLTQLETPHYTSYKAGSNHITRIPAGNNRSETVTDWYQFLVDHSANDSIYGIIHSSTVMANYQYGSETGEYLLVNKKRLPAGDVFTQLVKDAEEAMGELNKLFAEDGYLVVTTREVEALIPKLENIVNVTDKLGRHFIELKF